MRLRGALWSSQPQLLFTFRCPLRPPHSHQLPFEPMERRPPEPKRSGKEKARREAAMDDDGDDEVASSGGCGEDDKKRRPPSAFSPPSAAAARRVPTAAAGGGAPQPSCQAERCTADLTEAKRYHRRHKVCEAHSKAAAVMVAGLRQRFCQQCSRFHELSEFDDAKRSCRRRLAGHNERRRKSAASEPHGEGSSRCRQADQGGRMEISLSGNTPYKHFQIR